MCSIFPGCNSVVIIAVLYVVDRMDSMAMENKYHFLRYYYTFMIRFSIIIVSESNNKRTTTTSSFLVMVLL